MAIYIKTEKASDLLGKIKKSIDDGSIATWKYDEDGDFYHSPDQWNRSGWLRPHVESDGLVFGLLGPKDETMSTLNYAIYHGRFTEMLLNHFDKDFVEVKASAQKTKYDIF